MLVATTIVEPQWPDLAGWQRSLAAQQTELMWDVAITDASDRPRPQYLDRLVRWSKAGPFGPTHRVRLLRVGDDRPPHVACNECGRPGRLEDANESCDVVYGTGPPGHGCCGVLTPSRLAHARQLLWDKFGAWRSYEHLLLLDVDVQPPRRMLQRLYEADLPWAVALLNGEVQPMRCALLRGELVRGVPFDLAEDGDVEYSRTCIDRGIFPALVPVRPDPPAEAVERARELAGRHGWRSR